MSVIGPGERVVLRAFLEYELNQFPEVKRNHVTTDDYLKRVETLAEENPCNFFRLQSITNMGCVNAEVAVTNSNFNPSLGDYIVMLPPSCHTEFSGFYPKEHEAQRKLDSLTESEG